MKEDLLTYKFLFFKSYLKIVFHIFYTMKKTIIIRLLFLCFLLIFPLLLTACGKANLNDYSHEYISEYRKNLFIAKTGLFTATFTSGEREENYIMDGAKTKLVDFGVLTVKFNSQIDDSSPQFELKINDKVFADVLELNPYDGTFVYDTLCQVDDSATIELYLVDLDQREKLVCVSSDWNANYKEAIDIFSQKYNKELKLHTANGKLNAEIYVKIVSTNKDTQNIYWYVLCVCKNGDMYACLIDPITKAILQS